MNRRVLVLNAAAGASGDMFAGALIGAGAAFSVVREHVLGLGVAGLDVRVRPVVRGGVAAHGFEVFDPATGQAVDQTEGGADHGQPHRGLGAILSLLRNGDLPAVVRDAAAAVFERLAVAEAEVHGVRVEEVHFHEVGALDAIADVVAGASALWQLGVEQVLCSPVHVGCGTVRCAHGVLPVPAPATAALLRGCPCTLTVLLASSALPPAPPCCDSSATASDRRRNWSSRPRVVAPAAASSPSPMCCGRLWVAWPPADSPPSRSAGVGEAFSPVWL